VRGFVAVVLLACSGTGMVRTVPTARIDPALAVRIGSARDLRYADAGPADRPAHVRAASGLAVARGRLLVIQDDAAFVGTVAESIGALALPAPRFAPGDKPSKLDLEACVAIGDQVWGFGSGSTPTRERIVIVDGDTPRVLDAAPLYTTLRSAIGGSINIEGAATVGSELWLFHRGNTGPGDAGPAVVRFDRAAVMQSLATAALGVERYDLGAIEGIRLGFTDAVAVGDRVFYLAAAEASPNAYDDGRVLGSQLGVIDRGRIRAAPLEHGGGPIKAEGLAIDPAQPRRAWIAIDPDDGSVPARLLAAELVGPW
jgi:hypothetical protein